MGLADRIADELAGTGRPLTVGEIASALHVPVGAVDAVLSQEAGGRFERRHLSLLERPLVPMLPVAAGDSPSPYGVTGVQSGQRRGLSNRLRRAA